MTGRLVVMASGAGTNLGAILEAIAEGRLDATVVAVIINRRDAGARLRAERAGVPVHYRPLAPYRTQIRPVPESGPAIAAAPGERAWVPTADRRRYDADLAELVAVAEADLVVLAGWMHLLSSSFLARFPKRVINLHPALPGEFPGSDAIADAWEAFRAGRINRTGVMVHYVPDEGVDSGPAIASVEVAIGPRDTLEALRRRIRVVEHELIVRAVAAALADRRPAPVGTGASLAVAAHSADLR
ncbi:MAG: phosphoribosylglycinamide formyltransferase [bacterium]|nr:phosphoribosylglycinamide formyltransferase [bacterium]